MKLSRIILHSKFCTRFASLIAVFSFVAFSTSCDVLLKTASEWADAEKPLTTTDVANGLKEALKVGVDSSMFHLNKINGYYLDPKVKIELPPEVANIVTHARRVPGLDTKIEELIVQINRSAEDAAAKAVPIFKNAIVSMTIEDAWGILNGVDNAATSYLSQKTSNSLLQLYRPIMKQSLDKPLVANISANTTWNEVTGMWNNFATSLAGRLLELQPVNTELDVFVTQKAIDGVFLKVEEREKLIRTDANARVNDILRRVFGQGK